MKRIAYLLILILLAASVTAATVSHTPSQVVPGTYQAGTYRFPNNVTAGNVTATQFFGNLAYSWLTGVPTIPTAFPYANITSTPTIPTTLPWDNVTSKAVPTSFPYANITSTPTIPTSLPWDNVTSKIVPTTMPYTNLTGTVLNVPTVNVSQVKLGGDLNFTTRLGNNHSLAIMSGHFDDLTIDTLLDASRSTLSTNNSNLTYTLFTKNGLNGAWNFNGILYPARVYNVNNASITLLNGTNSSPKMNYVHFYLNGNVPTLTTTETYPTYNHIDVATFVVGEVLGNSSVIYAYSRNRYELDTFVSRVISRFEDSGTQYVSGFTAAANTTNLNISTGVFYNGIFKMTTTNNVSAATDGFFYINATGHYKQGTNFRVFTRYSDGTAIGANDRVNIILGVVPINTTGGVGPTQVRMMAVLQALPSTGAYTTDATALADAASATSYYPPNSAIKQVFVPVARIVVRPSTGVLVQFSNGLYYQNIAGLILSGGGTSATVDTSAFLLADGTRPLTANWNTGAFNITTQKLTANITLFNTSKICFGSQCQFCQYYNGTHLVEENPCSI